MRRVATLLGLPPRELWLIASITALIALAIALFAATALGQPARPLPGGEASPDATTDLSMDLDAPATQPPHDPPPFATKTATKEIAHAFH